MSKKIAWYPYLKRSEAREDKKGAALLDFVDIVPKNLVVCQQLKHRSFALFNTYLEYAMYCVKHVVLSHRCFYEVIFGNHPQKPYFDIDVPASNISSSEGLTFIDAEELCRQVISGILKQFDYIKRKDIMIFTSHSEKKSSYHIVVDNWCVSDHEENKIFCEKVLEHVEFRFKKFVDHLVYKTIQQLRIYDCHKFESDRTKIYSTKSQWNFPEQPMSEKHKYSLILGGSLIGNVSYCKLAPSLKPLVEPKKKWDGYGANLNDDDPEKCLDMMAELAGLKSWKNKAFPYTIKDVKGSLILLQRHRPSHCRICNRVHENEHPYLIVVGENRDVYFNCRRADSGNNYYIGRLGKDECLNLTLPQGQISDLAPEILEIEVPQIDSEVFDEKTLNTLYSISEKRNFAYESRRKDKISNITPTVLPNFSMYD